MPPHELPAAAILDAFILPSTLPPIFGAQKGSPLPKLKTLLDKSDIIWSRIIVSAWYDQTRGEELDIASSTVLWYRPGTPVLPSARCLSVTLKVGVRHKPSSAPMSLLIQPRSSLCLSAGGRSNSPLQNRRPAQLHTRASRRRNTAPVVRQGYRPNNANPAGPVKPRFPMCLRSTG